MSRILPILGFERNARLLKRGLIGLAVSSLGVLPPVSLLAQPYSSDACGFAAVNQYPVSTTCNYTSFNLPTAYHPASPNPSTSCGGGNYDDAYGWFTATGTSTTITYAPTTFSFSNPLCVLQVFSGTCAAPVLIGCGNGTIFTPATINDFTTTVGLTYFFRVQRYHSNYGLSGTICITSPPPTLPTTGDCTYTLTLNDSYGDGWEDFFGFGGITSSLELRISGISYGTFSQIVFDGTPPITFGVNNGQTVQLIYDGSGPSQGDNSYSLTSCSGAVLYSSGTSSSGPGLGYSGTVACGHAPPTDCIGAVTICSSTPTHIINTVTNTGCSPSDINGSNSGCITTEAPGTWYYFSPQTSGTVGFTIAPHTFDNYDFSLWGPYTSAHCPNTPPLRCSNYASYGTNTGLGTGTGYLSTIPVIAGQIYVLYITIESALKC